MGILTDVQKTGEPERKLKNVVRRSLKVGEEFGELAEAALSVTSVSGAKGKRWMDLVEEACDVTIMGLDIALTKPEEWGDIDDAMWRAVIKKIIEVKLAKWKHQLRKGNTITAEGKLPEFTDEEKEAFLGLIEGMREDPPETLSEPERDAVYRGRGDIDENAQEFVENARRAEPEIAYQDDVLTIARSRRTDE